MRIENIRVYVRVSIIYESLALSSDVNCICYFDS